MTDGFRKEALYVIDPDVFNYGIGLKACFLVARSSKVISLITSRLLTAILRLSLNCSLSLESSISYLVKTSAALKTKIYCCMVIDSKTFSFSMSLVSCCIALTM
jgi:hypothetical protein